MNEVLARAKERKVSQSYSLPQRIVDAIYNMAIDEDVSASVMCEALIVEGITSLRKKKAKFKEAKNG